MTLTVNGALSLAAKLHEGQRDKAGEPYLLHLVRVLYGVRGTTDVDVHVAALLHDAVEDGHATLEVLQFHEVSPRALSIIDEVTRKPLQPYVDYIRGIRSGEAALVKAMDIADNLDPSRLAKLPEEVARRLVMKYTWAATTIASLALCEMNDIPVDVRPTYEPPKGI